MNLDCYLGIGLDDKLPERRKRMKRIYYCKALKKTGRPIVVLDGDKEKTVKQISGFGHWRVKFNNAGAKVKSRWVTTVLEVWD